MVYRGWQADSYAAALQLNPLTASGRLAVSAGARLEEDAFPASEGYELTRASGWIWTSRRKRTAGPDAVDIVVGPWQHQLACLTIVWLPLWAPCVCRLSARQYIIWPRSCPRSPSTHPLRLKHSKILTQFSSNSIIMKWLLALVPLVAAAPTTLENIQQTGDAPPAGQVHSAQSIHDHPNTARSKSAVSHMEEPAVLRAPWAH